MYERKSRLSGKQRGKMIGMFVGGGTARAAAEITGVNRNTFGSSTSGCASFIASNCPAMSFQEKWMRMRAALVESEKANEDRVPQAR